VSKLSVSFCFFGFVILFALVSCVSAIREEEARARIDKAQSEVVLTYKAILEAEEAGANVSDLLDNLNDSVGALSKAYMFNRSRNFDEAIHFADLCYESVVGIKVEANRLRDSAVFERKQRLLLISLGSTLAVGCSVFGAILSWGVFKRWYHRRVLEMRPEVVQSES